MMLNSGRRKKGTEDFLIDLAPRMVMVDTGCRAACGGARWHQELQVEMKMMGRHFIQKSRMSFSSSAPEGRYNPQGSGSTKWVCMAQCTD